MAGPGFQQLFGGNNIYTAMPSFLSLDPLTASIVLQWPVEQSFSQPSVADIIEVNATVAALTLQFSDARETTTGYCTLINNIGALTFSVLDAAGNTLASIASGEVWQLYLADNTTLGGTWRIFQFGAGASSANAAALAGAGLKAITTTLNENMVFSAKNAPYAILNGDRAVIINWTGGTGTMSLPDPATVGAGWFVVIKNTGSGIVTVTPAAGTIDLVGSIGFAPDESAFVATDGTNYATIGFGQQINSVFDFIQIDLTGDTGNVPLVGAQLNRVSYRFIGAITGNVNIIVPNTIQQYWVDNETTGAFTLTVKTAAGTGIAVGQGSRNILYCDGVNVTNAVTFGSTGFTNGTAANPSIFFTASPHSGLYSPGADRVAITTASAERMEVNATGHFHIFEPDDNSSAPLWVEGNLIPGSQPTLKVTSQASTAAGPLAAFLAQGAGGFAILELMSGGAGGVLGTNDFAIIQDDTFTTSLFSRDPTGSLNIGAGGHQTIFVMDHFGQIVLRPFGGVGLDIHGTASNYGAHFRAGVGPGSIALALEGNAGGDPILEINGSATVGSTTASFTSNIKPGSGNAVGLWLPISIGGTVYWIPLWNN